MAEPLPDPIPAATLVVFRDRAGSAPELLMVERAKAMAFAAGALVFPGGRIDPGDHLLAAQHGEDPADMAGRVAAIRETIEETGIAVGVEGARAGDAIDHVRAGLHTGQAFADLLAATGLSLAPHALVPFARWCPRHRHARIFDTRFYLARVPADAPAPVVDDTENSRAFWASATAVLEAVDAGRDHVIFPTRRNLERLAGFASFAEAAAHAAATPQRIVTPWTEARDGVDHLCIPDDLGYPVTAVPLAEAMRG